MKSKFLFLMAALCALAGCRGQADGPADDQSDAIIEGAVELLCDRDIIIPNGSDCANLRLIVTDANGIVHDVTNGAEFFISGESEALASSAFTTTTPADYELYAIYGMSVSEKVKVSAIEGIAELPENKGDGEFAHRILLIQHTGHLCPACPRVISVLKTLSEDPDYASRYCHVASHSYHNTDPAFSISAQNLSATVCSGYYPDITYNYNVSTWYSMEPNDLEGIKRRIDELQNPYAAVGITATVTHKDGKLYVNSEIKSVVNNEFRLAYWVLEDGIYAKQEGATAAWQNTHDNTLQLMYGSSFLNQLYGESVGTLRAGESVKRIVAIDCNEDWVLENCKVVIMVSSPLGDEFEMENAIVCPVGGSVAYEYQ
ncbi:MAG: Omp28-related outer membrane protein [Tidjanibacter sp.]|nr:Omp28-related outer membrane protein [Tidjanibacter sp.]